jgi:hypothetical protein
VNFSNASRVALAATALLALGCQSNGSRDLPTTNNPGGGGGSGGGGRTIDGGGAGDLKITIIAPKAMEVIKSSTSSEVRARVVSVRPGSNDPSGDPVDPTSIQAALRRTSDNSQVAVGPLFGPLPNSEFAAPFDLSKVDSGDYELIVTGASAGGARGMAFIAVRVDAGPRIEINSPKERGSYKGSLTVQAIIDSAPFGPTMSVSATIGVLPIALNPTGAPNTYEALVEFLNLPSVLEGDQILKVTATNVAGTSTSVNVRFTIDSKGPALTDTEPKEGVIVGGIIRLRAKVADPAGVLGTSVLAVIGNRKDANFNVELKPEADTGFFSALFDTARLTACKPAPDTGLCIVYPNLSFRASDLAGNESVVAYDIGVDNQPPVVDLFPPPDMRVARYDSTVKRLTCSWPFDPLGDYRILGDMPGDVCAAPQVFDIRARIEDAGNRASGLKHPPASGLDPATVAVFVLADTGQALVVDVDGDGICDAINPKLIPTTRGPSQSNEVLTVRLAGVPPKGGADFTPDPALLDPAGRAAYPSCTPGVAPVAPGRLCGSEPLTVAIGWPAVRDRTPAIWSLEPITSGEPQCVGSQFDAFANLIPDGGWACIAAAATDRLGNTSVSNPLRVWVQYQGLPPLGPNCPAPPPQAGPPPNCTGSYNRVTAMLTGTPCRGRTFLPREVINEGALPEGM